MNDEINDAVAWLKNSCKINIPVLKQTARALEKLKQDEDNLSARHFKSSAERPFHGI